MISVDTKDAATVRTFRIALTGDFLDEQGASAYGELGFSLWKDQSYIQYHFLKEQSPRPTIPATGPDCIPSR